MFIVANLGATGCFQVTGSSRGNNLFQKCRKRLLTMVPKLPDPFPDSAHCWSFAHRVFPFIFAFFVSLSSIDVRGRFALKMWYLDGRMTLINGAEAGEGWNRRMIKVMTALEFVASSIC